MLKKDTSLIAYIMAGDPTFDATIDFLKAIDPYVDVIELGIPFSDPIADGPTIQASMIRALEAGMVPSKVFDIVKKFRKESSTPIVIMTYYNIVYRHGVKKFIETASDAGVTGMLIVDLPIEESSEYKKMCFENNIKTIYLAAPNTSVERLRMIDKASTGFVYLVSHLGLTGKRDTIDPKTFTCLETAIKTCENKIAVGFGISTPEHILQLREKADGIVVGSALIDIISRHGKDSSEYLKKYVYSLANAMEK